MIRVDAKTTRRAIHRRPTVASSECFQIHLIGIDFNGVPPPQFASPFDFDQGLARLILPSRTLLAV
ncbi:MAG: hypothetical protein AAGK24_03965, partial [Planctomycetota bacterium]